MNPTKRTMWAACAMIVVIAASCSKKPAASAAMQEGDRSCGPRCVRFVLEKHGQQVPDLLKLVQEIQGGLVEKPATMQSLCEALQSRGIYCLPVYIGPLSSIEWSEPAIIHLDNGHFAVLCRSDGTAAEVWNEGAITTCLFADLRKRMSGYVLLTSRELMKAEDGLTTGHVDFSSLTEALTWLSSFAAILICMIVLARPCFRAFSRHIIVQFWKTT